jgi:probable rRNA maturation factor
MSTVSATNISIDNRSGEELPLERIEDIAAYALKREQIAEVPELSISFVTTDEIQELNTLYRNRPEPTDVLSFSCDDPQATVECAGDEPQLLGDIVICPNIARAHAHRDEISFEEELWVLTLHGILHLFGFDHEDALKASDMEAHEDALLEDWATERKITLSWLED